ncbi:MAG: hypothetical protein MUO97_10755 [Dehalococcoidia bacterium]|nr:hypothetical protein [Dehalococcoidia bacterium]
MHSKLLFLVLTVTIPLILLASPIPVHAASITVAPNSGTVGTSIQIIGNGFAGLFANIHWDDQIMLSKIPISETGELTCNLKVPPACRGNHIIKITDDSNWTASTASATFTVFPGITIFPRIAQTYARVTVIGNGFAASEKDIRITWDGTVLSTSATADNFGTWSIHFDVPETKKGEHSIGAFSSSTNASEIGEHTFIVALFAKVEPTSGPVGTEISINGFGFRTSEDGITITWDNKIILCNLIAGTDGILSTTLEIPPSTRGYHTIGVYGSDFTPKGVIPNTDFDVVPHIELQPASGNKGTKVTANGTGFANGETITLSFEGMTLDAKAITDNAGSFSAAFEVPQSRVKDNKVKAMGSAGNSAEAIFVAEKIAPPAPTLLSPLQGAKLKIFDSFSDVLLGPAKRIIGIITFRDSRHQDYGPPIATFDWSDVNTEGKVSYTLQIARGDDFSSQVLLKENLVDSEYTLSRNDISPKDMYCWRVKAVDDVGNESPWSEVQEFDLINMSNQTLILSLTIPILFILAIVAVAILTWRKHRAKM